VDATVIVVRATEVFRATIGATPGSTMELIVNELLKARTIEINSGGQLVVKGKVIGDVQNLAGVVSKDPVISEKIKKLGALVRDNKPLIDFLGTSAVIAIVEPEITKLLASFPAGVKSFGLDPFKDQVGTGAVGAINIEGDYNQEEEAVLAVGIRGTNFVADGSQQYDRLVVSGTANISGYIGFALLNANGGTDGAVFQPPVGSFFDVVVARSVNATNLVIRGPVWGNGLQFKPVIASFPDGTEALRLVVTNTAPQLAVISTNNAMWLVFPTNYLGSYTLEATASLTVPDWRPVSATTLPVQIQPTGTNRFFRLRRQ
jgi:hypothetical protein